METIKEFTDRESKEWAQYITMKLARELARQKKITVSRSEIFNIYNSVVQAASQSSSEISFKFSDAGRFIDMKNINHRGSGDSTKGAELIEKLKDWVRRKGPDSFKHVPGYELSATRPDDEKAVQRIALGIFFNKMDGGSKHKRKKWWSHILYGGLNNLYGRLMYGYGLQAVDEIKKLQP